MLLILIFLVMVIIVLTNQRMSIPKYLLNIIKHPSYYKLLSSLAQSNQLA